MISATGMTAGDAGVKLQKKFDVYCGRCWSKTTKEIRCVIIHRTSRMEFATLEDDVRLIDETVKNKWRWDWLDDSMEQCIKKVKQPGLAFCTTCNKALQYKSSSGRT